MADRVDGWTGLLSSTRPASLRLRHDENGQGRHVAATVRWEGRRETEMEMEMEMEMKRQGKLGASCVGARRTRPA